MKFVGTSSRYDVSRHRMLHSVTEWHGNGYRGNYHGSKKYACGNTAGEGTKLRYCENTLAVPGLPLVNCWRRRHKFSQFIIILLLIYRNTQRISESIMDVDGVKLSDARDHLFSSRLLCSIIKPSVNWVASLVGLQFKRRLKTFLFCKFYQVA